MTDLSPKCGALNNVGPNNESCTLDPGHTGWHIDTSSIVTVAWPRTEEPVTDKKPRREVDWSRLPLAIIAWWLVVMFVVGMTVTLGLLLWWGVWIVTRAAW